jgi:hypothetical protein
MTEHKKIENLLRTAKFKSNQNVNKSVLQNLLERLNRDSLQVSQKPGIGGIIIRSRFSKLVAAAAVIIIIYSMNNYFADNSSSAALGAVIESMQKMNWIHGSSIATKEEYWQCFDPKIDVIVDYKGVISYRDYSKEVVYIYQPDSNTITINPVIDRFNQSSPESPTEIVQVLVKQFELLGGKVSTKRTTVNQRQVEIFSIVDEYQDVTLIVDADKNIPISLSRITHLPGNNRDATSSLSFDYPENGPKDIYNLGVPKDAQIIDNRPQGEMKRILDEIQKRYDAGFDDHIAVVLESYVRDNIREPSHVLVMRQNGKLKRLDRYTAFDLKGGTNISSLYSQVKDKWPELTIQNVLDLADEKYEEELFIYDGTTTIQITIPSGKEKVSSTNKDMFQIDEGIETLANFARCNPKNLMPSNTDTLVKVEIIPEDSNHEGLVGLSFIMNRNDPAKYLSGTTTTWRIKDFWFDPAKDYLLIERTTQEEMDGGVLQSIRRTTEAAQTESGKWYPKVIVTESSRTTTGTTKTGTGKSESIDIESSLPEANGKINIAIKEQRILVKTNSIFEEGIFKEIKISK